MTDPAFDPPDGAPAGLDESDPALVADLADAVADLSAGEDARRAAPHYLPALRAYADALIGGGTVPAS